MKKMYVYQVCPSFTYISTSHSSANSSRSMSPGALKPE